MKFQQVVTDIRSQKENLEGQEVLYVTDLGTGERSSFGTGRKAGIVFTNFLLILEKWWSQ